jgi:hypothetical protein
MKIKSVRPQPSHQQRNPSSDLHEFGAVAFILYLGMSAIVRFFPFCFYPLSKKFSWVKFSVRDFAITMLSSCDFRENRRR